VEASGTPVPVGTALGDEVGTDVGTGALDVGVDDGSVLGLGAGGPTVAHWFAQSAVSWCSQKQRSMQVAQLAQAGALEQPGVKPFAVPAVPTGFDEKGSSLEPPLAEHPASATKPGTSRCRRSAIRTVYGYSPQT
jgi:hypothetical protein